MSPRPQHESYAYSRAKEEFLAGEFRRVWGTIAVNEDEMTPAEKAKLAGKLYHHYKQLDDITPQTLQK